MQFQDILPFLLGFLLIIILQKLHARSNAHRLLRIIKTIYGGRHELVGADPSHDFPDADVEFYTNAGRGLARLGFNWMGYREDVTLSRAMPEQRSFESVLLSQDGTVACTVRHVGNGRSGQGTYLIQLETEFNDGSFLVTTATNGGGALMKSMPGVTWVLHPLETPLHRLLYMHHEAAGRLLHAGEGLVERALAPTFADMAESQHRLQDHLNRERQAKGWLTAEEMRGPGNGWPAAWSRLRDLARGKRED